MFDEQKALGDREINTSQSILTDLLKAGFGKYADFEAEFIKADKALQSIRPKINQHDQEGQAFLWGWMLSHFRVTEG